MTTFRLASVPMVAGLTVLSGMPAAGQDRPDVAWFAPGSYASVIAASSDGQTIVTSDDTLENALKVWRIDGTFIRTMADSFTPYSDAAFSPDGQFILAGRGGAAGDGHATAGIWRSSDGSLVRDLNPGYGDNYYDIQQVGWSPDGALGALAFNWFHDIPLYDAKTGVLVRNLKGGGIAVRFSPDGKTAAGITKDGVTLWNFADGAVLRTLSADGDRLAFSADGALLAVADRFHYQSSVPVFDTATGALVREFHPATVEYPLGIAFAPDQPLLIISGERDAADPVFGYSSDEAIDAYRMDGSLAWSYGHSYGAGYAVAFTPDGQSVMVAGGWRTPQNPGYEEGGNDAIQRLRASDGAELLHFAGQRGIAFGAAFSPDSQSFICAGLSMEVWRVSDGKALHTFPNGANSVQYSLDGTRLVAAAGTPIQIYSVPDYSLIRTLPGHGPFDTNQAVFSPDGQYIGSGGSDQTAKLWRVEDGALIWTKPSNAGSVDSVSFSKDGTLLAAGCGSGVVRLWSIPDGTLVRSISGLNAIDSIAFSPDGGSIAVAEQGYGDNLELFRAADATLIRAFPGSPGFQHQSVAFTPDGAAIVFSSGADHIQYWRVDDGKLLAEYTAEMGTGIFRWMPVAASPDGKYFGYGRQDSTVVMARSPLAQGCYPDFTGDGTLDLFDFLAYVNSFNAGQDMADCDGQGGLDLFDFLCFVNAFNAGC